MASDQLTRGRQRERKREREGEEGEKRERERESVEVKRAEGSSFSSGSLVCNAGHRERSTIDRGKARSRRERTTERTRE